MKVLLVYPEYPDTFWSLKHALRIFHKKANLPPVGLLTVASMLPNEWEKRLVDLNVRALTDEDIQWADYVFVSAMVVQRESVKEVIRRCKRLDAKIVAGGPLFTAERDEFQDVDHLILNEAEVTLPPFLADLEKGCPQHVYSSTERPDITRTPIPMWSLLELGEYAQMGVQYSRGCPFDCEFCDIVVLYGRRVRTKTAQQLLDEFEALYRRGWRGTVFIVDDNFIANKTRLKQEVLPAIIEWQTRRKHPFDLYTQASVNLADDEELMRLMVRAGFSSVFVGIETVNEDSLAECNKTQNRNRDLVAAVHKMQEQDLHVLGGFIVGFDSDSESVFEDQSRFIRESGIAMAMVGLLQAPRDTRLYRRLLMENRLLPEFTGDNTSCTLNFVPKMDRATLLNGYKSLLNTIYAPAAYYERVRTFLRHYNPRRTRVVHRLEWWHIRVFLTSVWILGVIDRARWHTLRFIVSTLVRRPGSIPIAMGLAAYGFHFRAVVRKNVGAPTANVGA